jgi:3D (Asp-Asp-Asp) domain-containing protein
MNKIASFKHLPQIVSAICLTAIFQFAACAQAKPESEAAQKVETNQPPQAVNPAVAPNVVTEAERDKKPAAPQQPNVQLPAAKSNVVTQPSAQKLHDVRFAEPEKDSKHAPKTFHASAYAIQGRTRSGAKTEKGVVAADPRVLPLGTVVQMSAGKYTGVYTVHDTGGAIKGNRVDVWMPSTKEARRFGRRNVKLVVLRYPGQNKPPAQKQK